MPLKITLAFCKKRFYPQEAELPKIVKECISVAYARGQWDQKRKMENNMKFHVKNAIEKVKENPEENLHLRKL